MLNEKNDQELEQINAERSAIVEQYEVCLAVSSTVCAIVEK